jgi:hypothetical protein
MMRIEHRSARSPTPIELELVTNDAEESAHLRVKIEASSPAPEESTKEEPLTERIVDLLRNAKSSMIRSALRDQLRVNNERLGHALTALEVAGTIQRESNRWKLAVAAPSNGVPRSAFSSPPPPRGTERRNGRT